MKKDNKKKGLVLEDDALLNKLLIYVGGLTIASAVAISFMQAQILDLYGEVDDVKSQIDKGFTSITTKLDVIEVDRREDSKTRMTEARIKEYVGFSVKPLSNKIDNIDTKMDNYFFHVNNVKYEFKGDLK